jgi:site-specific DNA-adenine methylase
MAHKVKLPPVPIFGYHGSKGRLAKHILSLLPSCGGRFVEPFAGRGNVYFAVAQRLGYKQFWLNDTYTFRFLMALSHLDPEWDIPERSRELFDALKDESDKYRKERERIGISGVSGGRYRPGVSPAGAKSWDFESSPPPLLLEGYVSYSGGTFDSKARGTSKKNVSKKGFWEAARLAAEIMRRTKPKITDIHWQDVLLELGPDDVVYFDPPYKNANVSAYSKKAMNYPELVAALLKTWSGFRWVLSEYEDEIYRPLTEKFGEPTRIKVRKHMVRTKDKKRPPAVECLWKNF